MRFESAPFDYCCSICDENHVLLEGKIEELEQALRDCPACFGKDLDPIPFEELD